MRQADKICRLAILSEARVLLMTGLHLDSFV